MNKNALGRLAEVAVLTEAIRRNYTVSFPWGGNAVYDLILEKDGNFTKVQVKTIYYRNTRKSWFVDLLKSGSRKRYCLDEIDLIACYRDNPRLLIMLPSKLFVNRGSLTITDKTQSIEW